MTSDEVLALAREAGFMFHTIPKYAPTLHALPKEYSQHCFFRLALAVEQATAERCAVLAEPSNYSTPSDWTEYARGRAQGADAIRAAFPAG